MAANLTVSHLLGEVAWLLTQSPIHRRLPVAILETIAMPALAREQLWIFREGDKPVGAAFWAYCGEDSERKLNKGVLAAEPPFGEADWRSGERIWLVDLIAPFATENNQHVRLMIADLASGPLDGKSFKFHQTDPGTGKKVVVEIDKGAGARLREAVQDTAVSP